MCIPYQKTTDRMPCAHTLYILMAVILALTPLVTAYAADEATQFSLLNPEALNFLGRVEYDSVLVDTPTVRQLGEQGWGGLLQGKFDDSKRLIRTSYISAKFAVQGYSPHLTIRVFHDFADGNPLFAVVTRVRDLRSFDMPITMSSLAETLESYTEVHICSSSAKGCSTSVQQVIDMPFVMNHLLRAEMTTYQLARAVVRGDTTCVWLITVHGPHESFGWEADWGLEVVDARSDMRIISWDGFPRDPENIKAVYDWQGIIPLPEESAPDGR